MREPQIALAPDLAKLLAEIAVFKGRWEALKTLSPNRPSDMATRATRYAPGG